MAKARRTRREKLKAQKRRETMVLTLATGGAVTVSDVQGPPQPPIVVKASPKGPSLFDYDPRLIRVDLTKTALLSILALATIIAMYWFKLL